MAGFDVPPNQPLKAPHNDWRKCHQAVIIEAADDGFFGSGTIVAFIKRDGMIALDRDMRAGLHILSAPVLSHHQSRQPVLG